MSEVVVALCTATRCEPNGSAMIVEVDPDETQIGGPMGKKWKQDDVAKDMMTSCADEAASKAAKEVLTHLAKDAGGAPGRSSGQKHGHEGQTYGGTRGRSCEVGF